MTDRLCECGCGAKIRRRDPSPDFKWPHCQQLWLASLRQPEQIRELWRHNQRILTLLMHRVFDWETIDWSAEWEARHVICSGTNGSIEASLDILYENYEQFAQEWWIEHRLPRITWLDADVTV